MLIFGMIGLGYLIWKKNKGLYEVFLIVSIIFIFPTIGMRTYSSYFFLVFFSLLAGICFIHIFKFLKRKKIIALAILISAILVSVGFVGYMFDHWDIQKQSMSEDTYDGAMYFKYRTNKTFIANDGLLSGRVGAISKKSCLPIGGATLKSNGPDQLIYGFLEEDDFQIIPLDIQEITIGANALYRAKGAVNAELDWTTIHGTHCDRVPRNLILRYELEYSLSNKNFKTGYWAYERIYLSRFLISLYGERYKIYDNGRLVLHYFDNE
jgi:hypothetical protein